MSSVYENTSVLNCKLSCIELGRVGSKFFSTFSCLLVGLGRSVDGLGWIGSHKKWTHRQLCCSIGDIGATCISADSIRHATSTADFHPDTEPNAGL